jgi:molybdate transport system permease protein
MVKRFTIGSAALIIVIYGMLIFSLLYFFDYDTLVNSLHNKRILNAIGISIGAATVATLFSLLIAIPAAYALSRYDFWLKPIIDVTLELPMIVSPAALGAMVLIFFQTPLGAVIRENGFDVIYAFSGIIVAQFVTVLGISTRLLKAVFDEIPIRYEKVARTLGANHRQAFTKVSLPLAKQGILSAAILTWAKAIGEFGATITVAGSLAMKTETIPTAIFMKLSTADIKGTVALILILVTFSIVTLIVARVLLMKRKHD